MTEPHLPKALTKVDSSHDSLEAALAIAFRQGSPPASPDNGESAAPREEVHPSAGLPFPELPELPRPGVRYQPLGELGRGGMGEVHRWHDRYLGRNLAVKILQEQHAAKPALVRSFFAEVWINSQLQHPGIVPLHELGQLPDGRPFFTMKLVKGQRLDDLLQQARGDLARERTRWLTIFLQVCQTLAYAHARGVIHRDLKSANIMVGAFGEVQVMDWGLAKVLAKADAVGAVEAELTGSDQSMIRLVYTEGYGGASQDGTVKGTPAYMAPEQARGEVQQLDERCDVFGLGAILCEILTGTPPYVGETPEEVYRQAAQGDLTDALALLDACSADPDLLRLARRCLAPKLEDRPRDAGVVAEELTKYLASVEQRLRAAELASAEARARAAQERKTRRRTVALAAALLGLAVGVSGGTAWFAVQRQHTRQDVEVLLVQARDLQQRYRWSEARWALDHANSRTGKWGPTDLQWRVQAALADLEWARRLDEIRLVKSIIVDDRIEYAFDYAAAVREYLRVFEDANLNVLAEEPRVVATRISVSAIREAWIAALDDWALAAMLTKDTALQERLLLVACEVEPDEFLKQIRNPAVWQDCEALTRLASKAPIAKMSPHLLNVFGVLIYLAGGDARSLLRAAQQQHPTDFWINFDLAGSLMRKGSDPEQAVGFLRAALVVRPECYAVYNSLGIALKGKGQLDEAIAEFQKAIAIDPKYAGAHISLGNALKDKGRLDEAIAEYREAIESNPKLADAHISLGNALKDKGQLDEAIAEYRKAIECNPNSAPAHSNLGVALADKGQPDEAIAEYHKAIAIDPKHAGAHTNLGTALADKGRMDEAIAEYQKAIESNPKFADAHYNLGNALKGKGQLDEAIAEYHKAIAIDPRFAPAHINLGNALKDKGRLDEAIAEYREAIESNPKLARAHGALGEALLQQGYFTEARQAIQRCLDLLPPEHGLRNPVTQLLTHCEQLLALDQKWSALIRDGAQPKDTAEQLAVADLCQHKRLYTAAARFYTDAFVNPKVADDLRTAHRYNAACAAALAGCGQGRDDPPPDNKTRARLRQQALDWLRADLTLWTEQLDKGTPQMRGELQQQLQHWQRDPDLAGLRDKDALTKLPEPERERCQKLWAEVETLLTRARK
jgi:serine/threonine-protein kinase